MEPAAGTFKDRLQREIRTQSARRDAPYFEPHVTLLGDLQLDKERLLETAAGLAKSLKRFRINLQDVSYGHSFHQCVYILCAKEPDLLAANKAATEAFGKPEPPNPYMPHLSLLYSDADEQQRQQAASEAVQRLWGEGSGYDTLLPDNGYSVGGLSVWYTPAEDKTLESWTRVAEFNLG